MNQRHWGPNPSHHSLPKVKLNINTWALHWHFVKWPIVRVPYQPTNTFAIHWQQQQPTISPVVHYVKWKQFIVTTWQEIFDPVQSTHSRELSQHWSDRVGEEEDTSARISPIPIRAHGGCLAKVLSICIIVGQLLRRGSPHRKTPTHTSPTHRHHQQRIHVFRGECEPKPKIDKNTPKLCKPPTVYFISFLWLFFWWLTNTFVHLWTFDDKQKKRKWKHSHILPQGTSTSLPPNQQPAKGNFYHQTTTTTTITTRTATPTPRDTKKHT